MELAIKIKYQLVGQHVHIYVYVGPDTDHLASAGKLIMRKEEWEVTHAVLQRRENKLIQYQIQKM